MSRARTWLVLAWLAVVLPGAAAIDVPYVTGRITDNAELLSADTEAALGARMQALERERGDQLAVLTVPSLNGAAIEEYAAAVFAAWKLGQAGKDNGVLLVVAPAERRMRIEVGYGLEGTLPDVLAGRIIRDQMTPRFAAGDYDGGVAAGVDAVIAVLKGGAPPPAATPAPAVSGLKDIESPDMPLAMRILLGAFIFGIIGLFTVVGVLTPGTGWFLYVFLIPFWAMFPIIVVGVNGALALLATYVVGFPLAKLIVSRKPWYAKARQDLRSKGRATIGGFTVTSGGSSGGSSWSSGGSSGSSFSGGGGSSGGGGASGSW